MYTSRLIQNRYGDSSPDVNEKNYVVKIDVNEKNHVVKIASPHTHTGQCGVNVAY